ncbi:centrosomal protein of 95 kDa isoform X2 [Engystomops pustulosus]|uniref:centrosomal protein of 95 kDa isoform X2 n=1 Tax=Engystomops pustulosus TaxID=76066 RepID=UPI003AFA748F
MGTQETDWVTVANSLLSRCHVSLLVSDLTQCDARFFSALYEAILGEKVPDYITDSHTAEDDAHNVQSVIDSLALDYLQVSLSHITGENVVRGDTESIRNLLEIFDGLLEYLTEQISEASSQNGDLEYKEAHVRGLHVEAPPCLRPPPSIGSLSSDLHPPSLGVDGSESTAELIRLGDTAHTFTLRGLDVETLRGRTVTPRPAEEEETLVSAVTGDNGTLVVEGHPVDEREGTPILQQTPTAVLLKPPYQPRAVTREARSPAPRSTHGVTSDILHGGSKSVKSPERRSPKEKKVAFRTLPDVRLMTQQNSLETWSNGSATCSKETAAEIDERSSGGREYSLLGSQPRSLVDEPLSVQRARNRLSELELQEMSEKLSRRLDELDRMLKKALGDQTRSSSETKEDDKLSQHSDSIMEIRRKTRQHAPQHTKPPSARPRSLSSSPLPPTGRTLSAQFEDLLNKEAKGDIGKIRRDLQKELDLQRLKSQLLFCAYEEEFKDLEETEKQKLVKMKEKLREEEQEFKENIFKNVPKKSHPEKVYGRKPARPPPKPAQWTPTLQKSSRVTVKENELLPLLLEDFPHLQVSPHALRSMWKGQMAQVEQLARSSQEDERSQRHLQKEVEEAHRKRDLLVQLIQREQNHKQRLKDFKDRIRLQKSAQNRMRETRQQAARAKRYYDDYHVQLRAKLMRARTREERIFKNLFEEGLDLQKQRLQEMRSYAKEQREEQRKRHKDELESMENYYKDQFSMLAEAVSQEQQEIQVREKTQAKTLQKVKRELRAKMEKEIQDLQELILRTDEDAFFRELEAERLKRRLHLASFQYSKSHCL